MLDSDLMLSILITVGMFYTANNKRLRFFTTYIICLLIKIPSLCLVLRGR